VIIVIVARRYRPGVIAKVFVLTYFPLRFLLEFLRANDLPLSDARYWSLTPAQWGSLLLFFIALLIVILNLFLQNSMNKKMPSSPGTKIIRK